MPKIKTNIIIRRFIVIVVWIGMISALIYSRFVNLDWGFPYPMHPDERNMAIALQNLHCENATCFNPHFFAYGQFPLYITYLFIWASHRFKNFGIMTVGFWEAILGLRIISATASVISAFIIYKIVSQMILHKVSNFKFQILNFLIIIFVPFFIQFSHFGTTESLLMMFYCLIMRESLLYLDNKSRENKFIIFSSWWVGLAAATKISSVIFITLPIVCIIISKLKAKSSKLPLETKIFKIIFGIFFLAIFSLFFTIFLSPHNFISWPEFLGSIRYETDVAFGRYTAFYTRQFIDTVPILFQIQKIFPYTLGLPIFILGIFGFFGLDWKSIKINFLRFSLLVYFLPNAFLFAKWTRFMAPVFPVFIIFSILFINRLYRLINSKFIANLLFGILAIVIIIPGVAYLSIYQNEDVRYKASEWIFKNIPGNSSILSETANVVDIPIENPKSKIQNSNEIQNQNYKIMSFNFYDLDNDLGLQKQLDIHLAKADYIFIPSRRIFMNYYCGTNFKFKISNFYSISNNKCQRIKKQFPILNKYYDDLFSGKLGFTQIAQFSSYPQIKFQILNFKFKIVFPDEQAEETFSVFDHPVIRIYKRQV